LRDASAYQEREAAQLRDRLAEEGNAARIDFIKRLLPALDGLEEALASGRRLLEQPVPQPFWNRLIPARGASRSAAPAERQALAAWLDGLTFVRDRLLDSLAVAGVVPIAAVGQPFDPHRHLAVQSVDPTGGAAPGTVVGEHRRGYAHGDAVLRYSEVVVARH
jgi:molecular chaperone GrpE